MTKYRCKNAPETVLRIRKIQFCAKNGLHLKLTHIKAQKMILSGRYGDPYGRPGDWCRTVRLPDNPGEGWHVCHWINHCLVVKYQGNQLHYPLDSDLSGG